MDTLLKIPKIKSITIPPPPNPNPNPKIRQSLCDCCRQLVFCSLAVLAEERNPLECLDAFGATGRKLTVQKELKTHDDNK